MIFRDLFLILHECTVILEKLPVFKCFRKVLKQSDKEPRRCGHGGEHDGELRKAHRLRNDGPICRVDHDPFKHKCKSRNILCPCVRDGFFCVFVGNRDITVHSLLISLHHKAVDPGIPDFFCIFRQMQDTVYVRHNTVVFDGIDIPPTPDLVHQGTEHKIADYRRNNKQNGIRIDVKHRPK